MDVAELNDYKHSFFTMTGFIEKSELKKTKNGKNFLSLKVRAGKDRQLHNAVIWGTYKEPQKPVTVNNQYKEKDFIRMWGVLSESSYTPKGGETRTTYNMISFTIDSGDEADKPGFCGFDIVGFVKKIKGNYVTIETKSVEESNRQESEEITVYIDDEIRDQCDELEKGAFVQIQGDVINRKKLFGDLQDNYNPAYGKLLYKEVKNQYESKIEGTFINVIATADNIEDVCKQAEEAVSEDDDEEIPF